MTISTIEKIMLYCPKCNTTYEDESQRFCLNDGGRLLPAPSSIKAAASSKGVFSSVLRSAPENEIENDEQNAPRVFVADSLDEERNSFHTKFSSKIFSQLSAEKEAGEKTASKPVIRLVRPNEIPSGTANIGDRKVNPMGRTALSRNNPQALIGQTIKGRYLVTEALSEDDTSIIYLSRDKAFHDKEMIVRVLMEEETDDFLSRIFAEERVSLSHINHPNIVRVLDSGELPEGKPFIVSEMVDGFSVKEKMEILDRFEPSRAAKIIRQAANALSELHQNGILHRNLRLDNIFLTITDAVTEQVKVTDFAVSGNINRQNFERIKYLSPEQFEGRLPNYASDIYSLGVIAYEMLTGKYPFEVSQADKLLKAQKKGLANQISTELADLPQEAVGIIQKALAYESSERFPKARDFGDSLYNVLISFKTETEEKSEDSAATPIPIPPSALFFEAKKEETAQSSDKKYEIIEPSATFNRLPNSEILNEAKEETPAPWENRSPDHRQKEKKSSLWLLFSLILLALIALAAAWYFSSGITESTENSAPVAANIAETATAENVKPSPSPDIIEAPPQARKIVQPANTEYFQNSRLNLKGNLEKNFLGFSLYYPKIWQKKESGSNFIDVTKTAETGTPIEQFLVSYYPSRGTFKLDQESFPKLVEESNKTLAKIVPNYRFLAEGEKLVNNGWQGYEMSFEGFGETTNGEKINLWGKRLFVPMVRPGAKNGFVITILATSLSDEIKSVQDIGVKGDSAQILESFEPSRDE